MPYTCIVKKVRHKLSYFTILHESLNYQIFQNSKCPLSYTFDSHTHTHTHTQAPEARTHARTHTVPLITSACHMSVACLTYKFKNEMRYGNAN